MADITTAKHTALLTQTGQSSGHIDDLEDLYLKTQTGLTTGTSNDLWYALFVQNGATSGDWNDAAYEFLITLGVPAGHIDDMWLYFWDTLGGAIGPTVIIQLNSGGFCDYKDPDTTCPATGTYEAIDSNFTNPADTWLWEVVSGAVTISGGTTGKTVIIDSGDVGADVPFELKVTATDSVSTDTANRTSSLKHDHDNVTTAPVFIGPDINLTELAQNVAITPFDVSPRYSFDYVGTWSLIGTWPAGLSIDGSGVLSGTPTDPVADYDNLQFRASNTAGDTDSNLFTVRILPGEVAPVFSGTVPDQEIQVGVPYSLDLRPYFTGTAPSYSVTTGVLPTGITLDPSGIISGTATTEGETDSLVVTATNGAGSDATNSFAYVVWEAIQKSTIPADDLTLNVLYTKDYSIYFTGTVSGYGINVGWPPGFSIDAAGVVTGTATTTAEYLGPRVFATSDYEPDVLSNSFILTAGVAPVFSGPIPDQNWIIDEAITPLDTSTYFGSPTDATYSASGTLPAGVTLDTGTGIISGTPTVETTGSFTITCTNVLDSAVSNSVGWDVAQAPSGPAFLALTYDPDTIATVGEAYEMKGVVTGTGDLTTTHTADLYAPDVDGVYREFVANEAVWSGGRVVSNGAPDSEDMTNSVFANNGWSDKSSCTCVGGQTDPDGGSTAFRLTATAANGRWRDASMSSRDWTYTGQRVRCSAWVRRVTGTGVIRMYRGYYSNAWEDISGVIDGTWKKITVDVAIDDPDYVGFFLEDSGDSIDVWHFQMEDVTGLANQNPSEYTPSPSGRITGGLSTKTFASTNGNTVLNNVVTEAVGTPLAESPYLQYYPAAQNDQYYSNNLTQWLDVSDATATLTEVGITGEPNTATFLEDNSVNSTRRKITTPVAVGATSTTIIYWFKKTTGTPTHFPGFAPTFSAGIGTVGFYQVNTETGAITAEGTDLSDAIEVIDRGDWWQIFVEATDNGLSTSFGNNVYPARGTVWGVADATATGTVIIGQTELHLNATIAEVRGLGPIFTEASAVATDRTAYSFDIANFDNDSSGWYAETTQQGDFYSGWNSAAILTPYDALGEGVFGTVSTDARLMIQDSAGQVNVANALASSGSKKFGASYNNTDNLKAVNSSGVWSSENAYTGFNKDSNTAIKLFGTYIASRTISVSWQMRDLQRYDTTSYQEGKDIIDGLMT